MAYDAARQRVVLFGGVSAANGNALGDTWEWDGTTWTQRNPVVSPPAGYSADMAYDAARQRIVMFGSVSQHDDTWEWDGTNWSKHTSATAPAGREGALTYDAARQRVVMFGGWIGGFRTGETWEWDGTNWTQRTPAASPPPAYGQSMAYDAGRQRTVLFGDTTRPGDTWEWDGNNWTSHTSATSPPVSMGTAMAYDAARHRIVLFGGNDPSQLLGQTWEWDGTSWTQRTPATSPPGRDFPGMAYDSARGRVVLFGGRGSNDTLGDTWEWDGVDWTRRATSTPPARYLSAMTYDSARQRTVLFGGYVNNQQVLGDTWEWDGTSWTQRRPVTSPPARSSAAMTYDSARKRVVLFGGLDANNQWSNDTWEWDGNNWTDRTSTQAIPSRGTVAYDEARKRVVLFAGCGTGETWEWDGNVWIRRTPVTSPPARCGEGMAYDAARQRIVMFGGTGDTSAEATWEWDGNNWTRHTPSSGPSSRHSHAMVYDAALRRVVLFGGLTDHYAFPTGTWQWDGTTWTPGPSQPEPCARYGAGSAYDTARRQVVLFSGQTNCGVIADTWVLQSSAPRAVLVVSKAGLAPDQAVYDRLVSLGYSVSYMPEDALSVTDASNADLVVLSSSVHIDKIGGQLRNVAAPMLSYEGFLHDENALSTSPNGETTTGYKQINIADANSPIAAGLTGTQTVATTATSLSVAAPRGDADVVATVPGHPDQAAIVAYRKGDRLVDGTPAPAPRVGFFFSYNTPSASTAAGWSLFDAAVTWLGTAPVNDTPHPVADLIVSTAGLVPDQAVFDRLVTLGYSPKWMPESALDLNEASHANLVVLSSSVHPEKVGNKLRGLAVPLLTFEGYLHDDNGMSTVTQGETSTAYQHVSVTDPSSPLAAGLTGTVAVSSSATPLSMANLAYPSGNSAAHVVATVPGRPDQPVIFAYRQGDRLENGSREPAPAARVGFFFSYNTPSTTTPAGWSLFDAAVHFLDANPHRAPSWKILALIYTGTDYSYTTGSVQHRLTNTMTATDLKDATDSVTAFVNQDIPALDSGAMIPTVTVKVPQHPLTNLTPFGSAFWPSPADTAIDRDPSYDAVIVIWDPWVKDSATGQISWVGGGDGLAQPMGTGQTYVWINLDGAIHRGHRNVFKHEFGHSITWFFDAAGTAPKPAVDNHANTTTNVYVHCGTGAPYVWQDESLTNPIPNSIYNNTSGFTHDYYSGTTARPETPTTCLGIPPEAWAASSPTSLLSGASARASAISPQPVP